MATAVSVITFRCRNDDGSETTATWKVAENLNVTHPVAIVNSSVNNIRVRFELQETGGTSLAAAGNFWQLQVARNGGAFQDVNASSTICRSATSGNVSDSTATTDQLTQGTGAFDAGEVDTGNGRAGGTTILAANGQTECEFCFQIQGADVMLGDALTFQIVQAAGASPTVTPTNTVTLTITVGPVYAYQPVIVSNRNTGPRGLRHNFHRIISAPDVSSAAHVVTGDWSESLTQSDAWTRLGTFGRTLTESVTSSDAWTRIGTFIRTTSESVTQSDGWTRVVTFVRSWSDSVTQADVWTRLGTFKRTLTESVTQADSWARLGTFLRTLTESVTQADVWTRLGTFKRTWSDSVTQSDAWTGIKIIARSLSESVTQSDGWTRTGTFLRTTSESVTQADALARIGTFGRSLTESLTSSDAWTRAATLRRTLTDSVAQSDAWAAVKNPITQVIGGLAPVGNAASFLVGAVARHFRPDGDATNQTPGSTASHPRPQR